LDAFFEHFYVKVDQEPYVDFSQLHISQ
jgi:hypothetical protein